jgi:hypothetical protein
MDKKVKLALPRDTEARINRAVDNLEATRGVAACFWCGHTYREYDRDIEDAHLTECPEYPAESKKLSN